MNQILNVNGTIPISSRQMVRFAPNVPVEIALQCADGVRVEGRYGDRVKYTLTDHRTMCVNPYVADRIKELDIQPGELFLVCKRQAKKGNAKTIHWVVNRFGDCESQLEQNLRESLERVNAPEGPSVSIAAPSQELGPSAPSNGTLDDSDPAGRFPATFAQPSTDEMPPRPPDTQLAHALKTAIAAAVDAEAYAKALDYNIRFTTEDVRSMGITILIGMQQRTPR